MTIAAIRREAALKEQYIKLRHTKTRLVAENERLRAMLFWIETYEPRIVEDAEKRFGTTAQVKE